MTTDATVLRVRALSAYESGRRVRAIQLALPFALVGLVGAVAGPRPLLAVVVGALIVVLAGWAFVHGRTLERAVLPGTLAGFVPFAFAQIAMLWGHACVGDQCVALCIPACVAGGLVAGAMVAGFGWWKQQPLAFQGFAGLFSVLTGALGCSCVGYSGVMGLVAGLVLSSAASFVIPRGRSGGAR